MKRTFSRALGRLALAGSFRSRRNHGAGADGQRRAPGRSAGGAQQRADDATARSSPASSGDAPPAAGGHGRHAGARSSRRGSAAQPRGQGSRRQRRRHRQRQRQVRRGGRAARSRERGRSAQGGQLDRHEEQVAGALRLRPPQFPRSRGDLLVLRQRPGRPRSAGASRRGGPGDRRSAAHEGRGAGTRPDLPGQARQPRKRAGGDQEGPGRRRQDRARAHREGGRREGRAHRPATPTCASSRR